jgi:hypothetical protein
MKKKFEKPKKERLMEQIISYLTSEYDEITVVYLFGSFITGEFFSDIDIGIVTKVNPVKTLKFELDLEIRLEKIVGCPVDVRVLNYAPLSFCQNVIRQGIVIIDHNPDNRADFEGRILKKYFDFAPFRQRYLQEVSNAPI